MSDIDATCLVNIVLQPVPNSADCTVFPACICLQTFDFTADDLTDEGEIGRGAYGTVNRMVHGRSYTIMAVKVRRL